MRRVAIIALLHDWNPYYSISSVVKTQIRTLVGAGYRPRIILYKTVPLWKFRSKTDYRMCLPDFWIDEIKTKIDAQFYKNVQSIRIELEKNLQDIDVVLTHDLLYLGHLLPYNVAMRKVANKFRNIQWIHWSHSSPKMQPDSHLKFPHKLVFSDMPRSTFVSVTKAQVKGYAKMYKVPQSRVKVVHNPRATQDYMNLQPAINRMVEKYRLLEADIVSVMPSTFNRVYKQQEVCLYLMAALKEAGKTIRFIFANPWCHHESKIGRESVRILEIKWLIRKLGLTEEEIIITSEADKKLKHGCSEREIKELFELSNVYILSSAYETGSLVLMEAALTKNLCVINKKLKSLQTIAKKDALWLDFDTVPDIVWTKYQDKGGKPADYKHFLYYYQDNKKKYQMHAKKIIKELDNNKQLAFFTRVKREFNEQIIFEKQLKPLIEQ